MQHMAHWLSKTTGMGGLDYCHSLATAKREATGAHCARLLYSSQFGGQLKRAWYG